MTPATLAAASNLRGTSMRKNGFLLALVAAGALTIAACGDDGGTGGGGATTNGNEQSNLSGTIKIDGSSTVAPLSEAAAELFQAANPKVRVTVGTSGTGGGFEKFCAGETDISDASRPIKDEEIAACEKAGIKYEEVQVANDGLAVVANPQNDWANCLTVAQLKKIWDRDSKVNNWNQVDPSFPDEKLQLFGAGTDSGTFDYFTEAINGEEGRSRSDYQATEDDNVTVQGVSGEKGALGYFGLSYFEQNQDKIKDVQVDGGDGCVTPTKETVQSGEYKPLSRPLFIYPTDKALKRPEVKAFVEFYIANQDKITEQALFVPMTPEQLQESKDEVARLAGT
jgi:phosphate transport system substrate-binding protein